MSPQRVLRLLTILSLILVSIVFAVSFIENDLLPEPLREWHASRVDELSVPLLVVVGVGLVLILCAGIVGSVALLLLKKWGAWLHLSASAASYVVLPFLGPVVQHPIGYMVESVSTMVIGCLYGVAFF